MINNILLKKVILILTLTFFEIFVMIGFIENIIQVELFLFLGVLYATTSAIVIVSSDIKLPHPKIKTSKDTIITTLRHDINYWGKEWKKMKEPYGSPVYHSDGTIAYLYFPRGRIIYPYQDGDKGIKVEKEPGAIRIRDYINF